ncbi:hypothetical protein E2R68_06440 [Psychromonas sp. RZ22]|nr:hypothetical protein E2R68_06440 [Psychromonas sp. RZ22]
MQKILLLGLFLCESISFLHAAIPTRLDSRRIVDVLGNAYGEQAAKRGEAWVEVLGKEYVNDQQKLQSINQFFNQLEFSTDQKIWGENNYWATPLEFIGANAGDCEDFALAKYFSLLELGIKDERLRIVMVKAMMINQYHMVLAYYPSPTVEPLILDNLIGEIKVASERKDLIPIYSFNGKQLWLNKKRIQGVVAGKSSRLKRWDDLNRRMGLKNLRQPVTNME